MLDILFMLSISVFTIYKLSLIKFGIIIYFSFGLLGNLLTHSLKREKLLIEEINRIRKIEIDTSDKTILYSYLMGMVWKTLFWPGFALINMFDIVFAKKEGV